MTRVVMAVNNAGSNDYRVVKSAEVLAAAGFEVIVVGLLSDDLPALETRNGVRYLRVALPTSRLSLLPDLAGAAVWWARLRMDEACLSDKRPSRSANKATSATPAPRTAPKARLSGWLRERVKNFRPATSPLSVRLLFARYVHAYLPALLALKADVYHAHELWMLESCALAARARGARLVYDSHELEPHRNLDWCAASNAQRIAYERRYIGAADALFAVSPGVARAMEQIYQLPRVRLLRNTPWLAKLRAAPRDLRAVLGLPQATPLLVYTGLVTRNRGLELILDALPLLPEFHLAMVGRAEPAVAATLAAQASAQGLSGRVHAVAPVPPEELIDFIAGGDVAVIALPDACLSYRHALPNKLFEALFAGLPVVASDLPDMRAFVTEHRIGQLFDHRDATALASAVQEVHGNRSRYVDIQQREQLCRQLSFEIEAQELCALYADLSRPDAARGP